MRNESLVVIILITSIFALPTSSIAQGETITISRYNTNTNQWTNVTIENLSYTVSSDDPAKDRMMGELYHINQHLLHSHLETIDFFNLNMSSSNPNVVISIGNEMVYNEILLNTNLEIYSPQFEEFLSFLFGYHNRISGYSLDFDIWPVDIEVLVMESYPPQYGVNVKFRRDRDTISAKLEKDVFLVVGELEHPDDYHNLDWIENPVEVQSKNITIEIGKEETDISFDSFSYRTADHDNNYSNTVFGLFQETDLVIIYFPGNPIFLQQSSQDLLDRIGETNSNGKIITKFSLLPWKINLIGTIVLLPIIKRKRR